MNNDKPIYGKPTWYRPIVIEADHGFVYQGKPTWWRPIGVDGWGEI